MIKYFSIVLRCTIVFALFLSFEWAFSQSSVNYSEHIAPILYKNCILCHSPGQIAPFSLLTYKDAVRKAKTIKRVTESGYMPPWHADNSYSQLAHPLSLSQKQIEMIKKWVENGTPIGDTTKLPNPNTYLKRKIDKPDLVLKLPKIEIKGDNEEKFYQIKLPFQLPEAKQVCRCEFVPGNPKVVHHMDAFLYNLTPQSNPFDGPQYVESNTFPTKTQLLEYLKIKNHNGSIAFPTKSTILDFFPGSVSQTFPKGINRVFTMEQKGAFLIDVMHYGGSPVATVDTSKMYLYFCKEQPKRSIYNLSFGSPDQNIEPELIIKPNQIQTHKTWMRFVKDISILSVQPHAHLICKSLKAYAITPENKLIPLIKIDHWDFRWQRVYKMKKMVRIPANSKVYLEGVFDNTASNVNNPYDPPQEIKESIRTKDEMLQLWVEFLPYQPGDENISLE